MHPPGIEIIRNLGAGCKGGAQRNCRIPSAKYEAPPKNIQKPWFSEGMYVCAGPFSGCLPVE